MLFKKVKRNIILQRTKHFFSIIIILYFYSVMKSAIPTPDFLGLQ